METNATELLMEIMVNREKGGASEQGRDIGEEREEKHGNAERETE